MIVITGRWLTFGELWFTSDTPSRPQTDILQFKLAPKPVQGASCAPFHTLVNDLTVNEATLLGRFGKTNRYKVNRADARDGVEFEYIDDCRVELETFFAFYDAFARQKSLQLAYRRGLHAAAHAGELVLTRAIRAGETLVWHAYICSGESAALLHSASHFRGVADEDRATIARANRWLHWRDMLAFKSKGCTRYDWGGMFDDESVPQQASINNFKREFGGEPHRAYTCTLAQTLKGRAYRRIEPTLERLARAHT